MHAATTRIARTGPENVFSRKAVIFFPATHCSTHDRAGHASTVLPDAVKQAALAEFGDAIECRDLVGRESPAERAGILLRLRRVLRAGDRHRAFTDEPVERHLCRCLVAMPGAEAAQLGDDR